LNMALVICFTAFKPNKSEKKIGSALVLGYLPSTFGAFGSTLYSRLVCPS
jgi:hypothetical protein